MPTMTLLICTAADSNNHGENKIHKPRTASTHLDPFIFIVRWLKNNDLCLSKNYTTSSVENPVFRSKIKVFQFFEIKSIGQIIQRPNDILRLKTEVKI